MSNWAQLKSLWLPIAKDQPVGRHKRIDCPRCGWKTGTGAAIANHNPKDYSCYCNACGYISKEPKGKLTLQELQQLKELNEQAKLPIPVRLPFDFTYEIPEEGRYWLYSCGLTPTDWDTLKIGWTPSKQRVVLPIYDEHGTLLWLQMRAVLQGQSPKYLQPAQPKLCTSNALLSGKSAVIVEDIASAHRINLLRAGCDAHAIMGTTISDSQLSKLIQYDRVFTWLDPDRPGRRAAKKVGRTLKMFVPVHDILSELDPKRLSNTQLLHSILMAVKL